MLKSMGVKVCNEFMNFTENDVLTLLHLDHFWIKQVSLKWLN